MAFTAQLFFVWTVHVVIRTRLLTYTIFFFAASGLGKSLSITRISPLMSCCSGLYCVRHRIDIPPSIQPMAKARRRNSHVASFSATSGHPRCTLSCALSRRWIKLFIVVHILNPHAQGKRRCSTFSLGDAASRFISSSFRSLDVRAPLSNATMYAVSLATGIVTSLASIVCLATFVVRALYSLQMPQCQ